jgi:ABC-type multidrug transport system fused ATPase/permease subunit
MINKYNDSQSRNRFTAALWGLRMIWQDNPHLVLGSAACTLIRGAAPAGFALSIRGLINAVTGTMNDADVSLDTAMFWLLMAFAITIADSLTGLASQLLSDRLKSNLTLAINTVVMQHASRLDMPYIENAENREMLERVRQDPGNNLHLLFTHSQRAVLSAFQVISLATILAWLEPAVILFALILTVPFFIFQWRLSRRRYLTEFHRAGKRRWTVYFLSRLTNPTHAGEVKLLGIGGLLTDRFIATIKEFRDQDQKLQLRQFGGGAVFVTVTTIAFYALFARVILRAIEGDLSIGDLAIFGGAVVRLRSALEVGIQYTARAYEQTLYVADLSQFLQSMPMVDDSGTTEPGSISGALSVQDVCFTYPGSSKIILHDISFKIAPGETIAIVGENGSGKSTLAKLLARLYDADAGTIELDGIPIGDYPVAFLHAQVALMVQSFGRYEASLADNIAYGDWERLATDREALEQLAAATGVDHIAAGLPQGLGTQLGREFAEHDLSSGQWQLLAIARTLARRAAVLILDEPTSNIDARAEHALYAAIDKVAADITTIIISHRFSTISMADRILVMDEGRIVEQGTHNELMRAKGHYANLFALHEHYRMKEKGVI